MKFAAIFFLSALATAAYITIPEGMDQQPRCRREGQRCNPRAGVHCCRWLYCDRWPNPHGRWGVCQFRWQGGEEGGEQGREHEVEEVQEEQ